MVWLCFPEPHGQGHLRRARCRSSTISSFFVEMFVSVSASVAPQPDQAEACAMHHLHRRDRRKSATTTGAGLGGGVWSRAQNSTPLLARWWLEMNIPGIMSVALTVRHSGPLLRGRFDRQVVVNASYLRA